MNNIETHDSLISPLTIAVPPSAKAPNQLLSSPLDTDVSLICLIEAYPKTINLWMRKEQVIMSGYVLRQY